MRDSLRSREEGDDDPSLPSCSDLIGASTTQTGFGYNAEEALRSSRRATDSLPYPSCSDLIGASTTQIGFGYNAEEALRLPDQVGVRSEGDGFTPLSVMLRLDWSIRYANRRGRCGGGTTAEGEAENAEGGWSVGETSPTPIFPCFCPQNTYLRKSLIFGRHYPRQWAYILKHRRRIPAKQLRS